MVVLQALGATARAETLYDAFTAAARTNPTIDAQRAAVGIAGADKALSATGYAPFIGLNGDYAYHDRKGDAPGGQTSQLTSHPRGLGASLTQNVWNGFKTVNSVARDEASLSARKNDLVGTQQSVLLDVATAYANILRDRDVLTLRRGDTAVLEARARQTRYLFDIGQLTKTDVDQINASLARSRADATVAQSNLDVSRATFRSIVGHDPGTLEPAGVPLGKLPKSLAAAIDRALTHHPAILAATEAVRAASIDIDVEKAGYLPSLDLSASADRRWEPDTYQPRTILDQVSVMGRLTIPIYDRGVTPASVHRAVEVESQRTAELDHQRALVRANVVQSWGVFANSAAVIAADEVQVAASDHALAGIELEASVGQRTTMDVLIQEQALLDARVSLASAVCDRLVAGFRLLASTGQLSLEDLAPGDLRPEKRTQALAYPVLKRHMPMTVTPFDPATLRPTL